MFRGCRALEKLNVSNFNTKNVTDMHMMFTSCRHLTKLDISSFKLDNVNNMNQFLFFLINHLNSPDKGAPILKY